MATLEIVDYVCDICGTEISVNSTGTGHLSPIYCCGITVSEITTMTRRKAGTKKTMKKTTKKTSTSKKVSKKPARKTAARVTSKKKKK